MEITCPKCNALTELNLEFNYVEFACPSCKTVYNNLDGELKFSEQFNPFHYENQFSVGQKITLKGEEYILSGILIKEVYVNYPWAEYILQNKDGKFLYLSVSNGHWILLEEIDFEANLDNHPKTMYYQDMTFDLYDSGTAVLRSAEGFFDFDILKPGELVEFIHPPYILSFERNGDSQTVYYGKHISTSEIKKAFDVSYLPPKIGTGVVQPFFFDLRNMALSFCAVAILMTLTHMALNAGRTENTVLDTDILFENYNGKDFISPSLELKGSSAPLTIMAHSDVDNSWANVSIGLVNEKTSEEIYANKDIEYYHGYEGGENWSEGNTSEEFNICGVPGGKYHLVITPMKASEDTVNSKIHVQATWNQPSVRNVVLICVIMLVIILGLFYLERQFEIKRWADSDYSPYPNEN